LELFLNGPDAVHQAPDGPTGEAPRIAQRKGMHMVKDEDSRSSLRLDISPANYAPQKLVEVPSGSAASLRQLSFQYMQDGFSIVDATGLHVDVNPAFCKMTGYSEQELVGSAPGDSYWPPEELERIQIAFARTLSGEFSEVELVFKRKNGERFPVIVNPFAIRDHSGAILHYAATVKEITQRVAMETALQENQERYRALFACAGDAIVILKDDQIIDCNERALALTGRSRDEILSNPTVGFFPPTQPNGQDSQQFFAEKVVAAILEGPQHFEWTGLVAGDVSIHMEVTLTTFMLGKTRYTQSIMRDITRRKQLEHALMESEVRYRTLFESAGDAIAIHKNSRAVDCNERLSELYGLSREEILSSTTGDFFPPMQPNGQSSHEFFQEKVSASRAGERQVYEWHGRKRDGTAIITEITLTTFVIGGEIYEQAIARDITQRKQMEEALRDLNRTLEERVARRTDELEKVCAELLQRNAQYRALASRLTQAENEERRRIAQVLHDNHQQLIVAAKFRVELLQGDSYSSNAHDVAQQVLEILDQALEASRSLTMELAPPILFGSGLVVALQWLARWMEENYQLQVEVIGSLPMTRVPKDVSTLFFQAVRELLLNVIKHSGVRSATVSVTLEHNQLQVAVADTGAGFDVVSALETPRSFGLFSIQERLILLGGRLEVISQPGRGTTSRMAIPLLAADDTSRHVETEHCATTDESVNAQPTQVTNIRILVTDDHAPARTSLMQVLGLVSKFEIVGQAVDGLDALEQVRLLQPDIVLMDMTMPRLDGLEATRRLTAEYPEVKVIGLSMHDPLEMQPQMQAAGAFRFLHKSTPVDELIAAIRAAMGVDVHGDTEKDEPQ
jgi:PAS domain S-box-containing protein